MRRAGVTIVPPPATCRASSLVLAAVLTLAFVGAAHALSVDILVPETDPAEVYPQVRVRFLAEARDEKGNDVTELATFSWTFSDAEDSTVGNPVLHRFPKVGKFLVSVTATLDSDSGCDATTVIVIPYAGNGLRQAPGIGDFTFTANGHTPPAEVSDDVGLLVELVGELGEWWWVATEFQVYEDGQWVAPEGQTGDPSYGWFTTEDPYFPNGPVSWRAKVMLDEIGAEPPNGIDLHLPGTWTVVNTVVKSASPPLIFHHAEDTAHTIAWDLTHCEDFDPLFTMTVTIYDLEGNTVATLVRYNVPLEEENPQIVWNTNLPEEDGIYTYRIHASHNPPPPWYPCVDRDKSEVLVTTLDKFYWFEQDAVAGTLTGVVKYTLNQDAWPGSVTIRFFGPDLEELDYPLTDQPYLAGAHFSDVYEIDADYDENDELIGPIYCVIYANECEDTALLNRAGDSKPALQKGTDELTFVENDITPSGPVMISTLHDDDYPLEQQTADGQITITAHFDKEWAGQQIYLAVFDPPDMSPYVSDPQNWEAIWTDDTKWGDNADGPGTLSTTEATAVLVGEGEAQEAVVTAVLTITDYAAGDNYVVAAQPGGAPTIRRAMEEFDGGAGHLLVAWARKYYTVGEMYQGLCITHIF